VHQVFMRNIVAAVTVLPAGLMYFFICLTSQHLRRVMDPGSPHGLAGRERTSMARF
jgi:hypothetical protein